VSLSSGDARIGAPPPPAYETIRNRASQPPPPKGSDFKTIEFLHAKNGMPIAKRNGVFLDSSYNPEAAANARADRMDTQGKRAAVLFGDGFCYLARTLARQGLRVLVVEDDTELMVNALQSLGENAFRDFSLLFADMGDASQDTPPADFYASLESFIDPSWQISDVLIVPAAAQADPILGQAEAALITLFKRRKFNMETSAWFGERWAYNILDNLSALALRKRQARETSAHAAAGDPMTIPIHRGDWVIAAPGPSLDSAAALLGESRARFTLLALAPALRPLLDRGITPDLVASSDGGWANGLHLAGLRCPDIPLLFPLFCYGGIARAWQGPLIPFSYGNEFENLFLGAEAMRAVPETPTVALFALQLALRFGAERIFFAGQDFASFSSKGHARGYRFDADAGYRSTRTAAPEKYLDGTWRRGDTALALPGVSKLSGWRSDTKMRMYAEAFAGELSGISGLNPCPELCVLGASPLSATLPEAPPFSGQGEQYGYALPSCTLAPDHPELFLQACLRLQNAPFSGIEALFADPHLKVFFAFASPVAFYHYQRGEYARAEELLLPRLSGMLKRIIHRLRFLLNPGA